VVTNCNQSIAGLSYTAACAVTNAPFTNGVFYVNCGCEYGSVGLMMLVPPTHCEFAARRESARAESLSLDIQGGRPKSGSRAIASVAPLRSSRLIIVLREPPVSGW
jgi:hypothetical protein